MGPYLRLSFLTIGFIVLWMNLPVYGDVIDKRIKKPVRESINTRQATQLQEEKWRLEREKLIHQFETLQQKQEKLQHRKTKLTGQVASTETRIAVKKKHLADIEEISNQIEPFLRELIRELTLILKEDLPFLQTERHQRIEKINRLMEDPDVTISEKYRKIMEALLVEAEYGFSIETYQENIAIGSESMLVDIFRLGRLCLFYQTLDHGQTGFYNVATGAWDPLPVSYNPEIQTAIDIAAKRQPVQLLALPLGRMVVK